MEMNELVSHNLRKKHVIIKVLQFFKTRILPLGAAGAAGVLNIPWVAPADGVALGAGVPE